MAGARMGEGGRTVLTLAPSVHKDPRVPERELPGQTSSCRVGKSRGHCQGSKVLSPFRSSGRRIPAEPCWGGRIGERASLFGLFCPVSQRNSPSYTGRTGALVGSKRIWLGFLDSKDFCIWLRHQRDIKGAYKCHSRCRRAVLRTDRVGRAARRIWESVTFATFSAYSLTKNVGGGVQNIREGQTSFFKKSCATSPLRSLTTKHQRAALLNSKQGPRNWRSLNLG